MKDFEISAGSIVGKYHLGTHNALKGKNNQDSYTIYNKNMVAGVLRLPK